MTNLGARLPVPLPPLPTDLQHERHHLDHGVQHVQHAVDGGWHPGGGVSEAPVELLQEFAQFLLQGVQAGLVLCA